MVEQIVRWLALSNASRSPASRLATLRSAAGEVGRPIVFAGFVVIIVFLPILSLQGIEGKMFRPMAFSFMSALVGALVLSITIIPVMASLFLARTIQDRDTWLVRLCKRVYATVLRLSIMHPVIVTAIALAAFTASVVIASQFGAEFIPKLDEGDVAMEGVRLQSVSLDTSIRLSTDIEQTLMDEFPDEVQSVITKIGRPEIATDPMGVNRSDIFVMLKPPESWTKFNDKESLVTAMGDTLAEKIPGQSFGFSQPIELRKHPESSVTAIFDGAMDRLRPVLMTATTDALGFLPMALSTSAGAEVQRPLATVVIGGVITSSRLTLLVLPSLYRWFESDDRATFAESDPILRE